MPPADGGEELAGNASRVWSTALLMCICYPAIWRKLGAKAVLIMRPSAMKFALQGSMVERASNRIVEGGERSEVTELWTFMRAREGNWLLSAIQQT